MTEQSREPCRQNGSDCTRTGANSSALDRLRERLLVNPWDVDALRQAGGLLYEMGQLDQAVAHFEKALTCCRCPSNGWDGKDGPVAWPAATASHREGGSTELRCQVLKELADCHVALSDYQKAEEHYQAAVALDPAEAGPYLGLGMLACQRGQTEEARGFFKTAKELQPDCGDAYGGLAMIHQQRAEHSAAFEMYLKCLELDADNLVALLGLFQTSCQMKSFSKIIHYLEVYLVRHPADVSVLFCLATLYAREGRLSEAHRATLKVIEAEPSKQEATKLLSQLQEAMAGTSEPQG